MALQRHWRSRAPYNGLAFLTGQTVQIPVGKVFLRVSLVTDRRLIKMQAAKPNAATRKRIMALKDMNTASPSFKLARRWRSVVIPSMIGTMNKPAAAVVRATLHARSG
ncbi:hypothetical protein [Methylobacterium sp. P1-11]|uniref:hypothetical protein n=1 Tax=Methylobacterium sp. P1-11 TaxID=2024616 RepID=UPI001FEFD8AA|nr:hypothetical protein [Methylobacterium sp. P1-11]